MTYEIFNELFIGCVVGSSIFNIKPKVLIWLKICMALFMNNVYDVYAWWIDLGNWFFYHISIWNTSFYASILFFPPMNALVHVNIEYRLGTAYMRQLNLPPLFWNVSHLKIFPLELLGPAIGLLAGPSSCKGKILRWDTTTNSPTTNKCLILDVFLSRAPESTLKSLSSLRYFLREEILRT